MPEQSTDDAVVLDRFIAAPRPTVWAMWTDPTHFGSWYGPASATCGTVRFDLRAGGERVVAMTVQTPGGGRTMWFTGEYVEVDEPSVLVYTEAITDGDGGVPQSPITTVRLELTAEGPGTRLRLVHHGIPADSPGATGWQMALDKLEAALTS
jgi:uncharacterized protein YndB with AHSA1/START domain